MTIQARMIGLNDVWHGLTVTGVSNAWNKESIDTTMTDPTTGLPTTMTFNRMQWIVVTRNDPGVPGATS